MYSTLLPSPTRSLLWHSASLTVNSRRREPIYEQRVVEVENGSFTPLVFSATGGMGRLVSIFYSRLAMMLSEKRQQPFSSMMGWLRCVPAVILTPVIIHTVHQRIKIMYEWHRTIPNLHRFGHQQLTCGPLLDTSKFIGP